MKTIKSLTTIAIALLASTSVFAGQAEMRSFNPQDHAQALQQAGTVEAFKITWLNLYEAPTEINVWDGVNKQMKMEITKNFGGTYLTARMDVKVVNETCKGINTLGLLLGGSSSFAVGKLKKSEAVQNSTMQVADIFAHYEGSALGVGFGIGAGHWQTVSSTGLKNFHRFGAVPIPFAMEGADVALGYTSCDISYDLVPQSDSVEITINKGRGNSSKQTTTLSEILNLPF